ncbi:hypothetical protein [Luteibacter yeojuensis]|uniref:Uncharacterized protein n=1 Tax=Luteibacter yeojuensis TaxID=345309 RepID=A0A0F3KD21_9GAMM|nr:hypothetical protein [Luteibacter yeojuensis]KJV29130.1 hypothetical protein VI08_16230 [Luteibacter yeojuensis]
MLKSHRIAGMAITTGVVLYFFLRDTPDSPAKNKDPREWVAIEVDVGDLPIPIDSALLTATYTIENISCLKPLMISGATGQPFVTTYIDPRKVSPHAFQAKVPLDRFEDDDYHGRGVCHWKISSVDFRLRHGKRDLRAGMGSEGILASGSVRSYISEWSVMSAPTDWPEYALTDRKAAEMSQSGKIYTVTVTAKDDAHVPDRK